MQHIPLKWKVHNIDSIVDVLVVEMSPEKTYILLPSMKICKITITQSFSELETWTEVYIYMDYIKF